MFAKVCIPLLIVGNIVFVIVVLNWIPAFDNGVPLIARAPNMNAFLRQSRKLLALPLKEPLLIVLGNESCDLDSAVSAIALAYFYAQSSSSVEIVRSRSDRYRILPMLNIPRKFLPTKTEVTFFLQQSHIDLENVVCRDEISEAQFEAAQFILVDHHVSPQASSSIQIIDHRPIDPSARFPRSADINIQPVASCTTLIADLVLQPNHTLSSTNRELLLRFLYPVIVLDSVNFSAAADKAKALDYSVSERIARSLNISQNETAQMFDELVVARADIGRLDSLQILYKDMKRVVSKRTGKPVVSIPGVPISVLEYIRMPAAERNLIEFARQENCSIVVLMGMRVIDQYPQRDLLVIQLSDDGPSELHSQIVRDLESSAELELEKVDRVEFLRAQIYRQRNVKGSRKQVLPLVQAIVDQLD